MAIFSRRNLQRMIDENDGFLFKRQTKKHVDELNQMATKLSLDYEWEVVLLNVLSKFGEVKHEKKFNGKKPDVYFISSRKEEVNFVADITTVSDRGCDELYPYDVLRQELDKRLTEQGIKREYVSLMGGYGGKAHYRGGPRVEQKLPGRARFAEVIFGEPFNRFVRKILKDPASRQVYPVSHNNALAVIITYDPRQEGMWGGYEVYTSAFHITENVVYQSLERKVPQLAQTEFKGPLGIFLCDGDCDLFRQRVDSRSYSIDEIIKYFLNGNPQISFIVILTVSQEKPYKVTSKVYQGASFDVNLMEILNRLPDVFPRAESNIGNAINLLRGKNPNVGRSYLGGLYQSYKHGSSIIKISARVILDLLSGNVDQNKLFEIYNFFPSRTKLPIHNPFKRRMDEGELIVDVLIDKSDSDDDWLIFELKGPDPAISPFRAPKR
jgi:hypothetical protein